VLPGLANWVLVIFRLLLASFSAAGGQANQMAAPGASPAFPIPVSGQYPPIPQPGRNLPMRAQDPTAPPPTLHEIDINRHREITAKAVAALIFLTLKWFKVSRTCKNNQPYIFLTALAVDVVKFHHLGAMLLESNILLLILKILGLQETLVVVTTKNDYPDNKYVRLIFPPLGLTFCFPQFLPFL